MPTCVASYTYPLVDLPYSLACCASVADDTVVRCAHVTVVQHLLERFVGWQVSVDEGFHPRICRHGQRRERDKGARRLGRSASVRKSWQGWKMGKELEARALEGLGSPWGALPEIQSANPAPLESSGQPRAWYGPAARHHRGLVFPECGRLAGCPNGAPGRAKPLQRATASIEAPSQIPVRYGQMYPSWTGPATRLRGVMDEGSQSMCDAKSTHDAAG